MRAYHQLIYRTIDKKLVTCGLFLDFSKAFGTVDHKILLSKLCHYRIRGGIPYNWFQNYLHNRTQFVKIGSIQSNPETITWGILQASTLGPLLFLLYINDLPYSSKKKNILSYFKNWSVTKWFHDLNITIGAGWAHESTAIVSSENKRFLFDKSYWVLIYQTLGQKF